MLEYSKNKQCLRADTGTDITANNTLPHRFQIGDWSADANQNLIWRDDEKVHLEPKAMAILQYLVVHSGEVVSREDLFAQFWQDQVVTADALNRAMWNIRRSLGDTPNNPQYIATVRNKGYRLVAPSTILPDPRLTLHQQSIDKNLNTQCQPESKDNSKRLGMVISAIVFITVLGLYSVIYLPTGPSGRDNNASAVNLQRITYDRAQNVMPTMSTDGIYLAYIARAKNSPNQLKLQKSAQKGANALGSPDTHYTHPAFNRNGKSLAVVSEFEVSHTLVIFDINNNSQQTLLQLKQPSKGLSWHPSQNLLTYTQPHPISAKPVIYTLHTRLKQPTMLTDTGNGLADQLPRFSPDGKNIAFIRCFAYREQALFVVDLQGHSRRIGGNHGQITGYSWLDEDNFLLATDNGLFKLSLAGELTSMHLDNNSLKAVDLHYNRKQQQLIFSQTQHSAQIVSYPLNGKRPGHILTQSQTKDSESAISNNRYNLAFVSDRTGHLQLWLRQGNDLLPIESTTADHIYDLRWSPDNQTLAAISKIANDYFLQLINVQTNNVIKHSLGQQPANFIGWKNTKQLFYSHKVQGEWRLHQYDLQSKQTQKLSELEIYQARLTPDKRRLAFINTQTTDVWLWDWFNPPALLSQENMPPLSRNWFIDNDNLYYLQRKNSVGQSQLWQLALDGGPRVLQATYPALDGDSRMQKLIYNMLVSERSQLAGDIWSLDLQP